MSGSRTAQYPFDHTKAEVILRSSDNVDFYVFKTFLSLSSTVFSDMFDMPQPEDNDFETHDGLPVIQVSEDSTVMDRLLRYCYPQILVGNPKLETIEEATNLLEAGIKYGMDEIQKAMKKALISSPIIDNNPTAVYTIACHYKWDDGALEAAKYRLRQPNLPIDSADVDGLTGVEVLKLLDHHIRCADAALKLTEPTYWAEVLSRINFWSSVMQKICDCLQHQPYEATSIIRGMKPWWVVYIQSTSLELKEKPSGETLRRGREKAIDKSNEIACRPCRKTLTTFMVEFINFYADEVDRVTSMISLNANDNENDSKVVGV
ncbi:hypothetical protein SERLADRAFT_412754 [Serpula lacrymans var. lacrymans S7.9]|uniref:BTB domain-containing protein n=1 Tax=Serpula lacrymans var. lacrymans (strain S7.9) TaxID=578457 RepID=F8NGP9_SERL9|nr:uncharacterized protein SERLADRAFT_412754 [Serpula lacrymans var. lacrymans S7.9]EGO29131.1 hypothetical protein SERLADRAFT_412754 [Serpula lacrymans var. lacrymans S7.9]